MRQGVVGFKGFAQHEQGPLQVLLFQHIGNAHLVAAKSRGGVEAAGGSHHHRLALVFKVGEAPGAEFFGIVHGQLGHGVERAHRYGGIYAGDAVQAVDECLAAFHVFIVGVAQVFLRGVYAGFGHELANEGRGEAGLAELHYGFAQVLVFRDEGSHADAALRVAFAHRVDEHHVLLYAFEVACADVGGAGVDELAIDLVGEKVEVVFLHEVAYLVHLAARVEVARGIVGVADEYGSGVLVDEGLKLLHLGQREAFLDGGGNGANLGSRADGKGHVVGIGGFGHDNLIAGVEATHKGKQHGF